MYSSGFIRRSSDTSCFTVSAEIRAEAEIAFKKTVEWVESDAWEDAGSGMIQRASSETGAVVSVPTMPRVMSYASALSF
jgi:hypothetical protein